MDGTGWKGEVLKKKKRSVHYMLNFFHLMKTCNVQYLFLKTGIKLYIYRVFFYLKYKC